MREFNLLPLAILMSLWSPLAGAAPAAQLWPLWAASEESSAASIDHSQWQWFLDEYVVPSERGINLVAYHRVSVEGRRRLQSYLHTSATLDPRVYSRAEQLAYWVNLYNALTVEVVLANSDKGSVLRMGERFFSIGPWDDEVITIVGEAVTLNDIEHRILRPIWNDRRVHYALNCASLGCPNLDPQAYTRANAQKLLSASELAYINHSRGVFLNARGHLMLSQIYQWYADDFAGDRQGLLNYLGGHHGSLETELKHYGGRIRYGYDWELNASPRAETVLGADVGISSNR